MKHIRKAVDMADEAVGHPWLTMIEPVMVNDTVGGVRVLVVFERELLTSAAFDRRLDDQPLASWLADPEAITLKGLESDSIWDGPIGRARARPLTGTRPGRVNNTASD